MYLDYNSTMAINSCPIPYLRVRVRVRVSTMAVNSYPIPYLRVRVRVSTMAINSYPIPYLTWHLTFLSYWFLMMCTPRLDMV